MTDISDRLTSALETGSGCVLGGAVFMGAGAFASFWVPPLATQMPTLATTGCAVGAVAVNTVFDASRSFTEGLQRAIDTMPRQELTPGDFPAPRTPPAPPRPNGPDIASR